MRHIYFLMLSNNLLLVCRKVIILVYSFLYLTTLPDLGISSKILTGFSVFLKIQRCHLQIIIPVRYLLPSLSPSSVLPSRRISSHIQDTENSSVGTHPGCEVSKSPFFTFCLCHLLSDHATRFPGASVVSLV